MPRRTAAPVNAPAATPCVESLEGRRLLAAFGPIPGRPILPLNPENPRPITDPTFQNIPTPRLELTSRKTLQVIGTVLDDEITIDIRQYLDRAAMVIQVNGKERAVRLRDVRRIVVTGDFGNDEIKVAGNSDLLGQRRFTLLGDFREPSQQPFFEGNDTISGSDKADTILGGGGADEILGNEGPDSIDGGDGPDTIEGGSGNDLIGVGSNDDLSDGINDVRAGAGNDTVNGGFGNDLIDLGDGDDEAQGSIGDDLFTGGLGNDTIRGGQGVDTLFGEEGDDDLFGDLRDASGRNEPLDNFSHDRIFGGPGNDFIWGESGDDQLWGGEGSDTLLGQFGRDRLDGGPGNDYLNGHEGLDKVSGGPGRDKFNEADRRPAGQFDFNPSRDNPVLRARVLTNQITAGVGVNEVDLPIDVDE